MKISNSGLVCGSSFSERASACYESGHVGWPLNGPRSDNGEAIVSLTFIPLIIRRDYYDRQRPIVNYGRPTVSDYRAIVERETRRVHAENTKRAHERGAIRAGRAFTCVGDRHVYVFSRFKRFSEFMHFRPSERAWGRGL